MSKTIIFGFLFFTFSCSSYKTKPLKIIIKSDLSYKYDLSNETYTVFYTNKPPQEIRFHLSDLEKKEIYEKYYSLRLDKIKKTGLVNDDILVKDKCEEMPKNKTVLHVQSREKNQEIKIDLSCNSFYLSNFIEADRIKTFIVFTLDIIRSKPQIKEAPSSDIMYM